MPRTPKPAKNSEKVEPYPVKFEKPDAITSEPLSSDVKTSIPCERALRIESVSPGKKGAYVYDKRLLVSLVLEVNDLLFGGDGKEDDVCNG